MTRPERPVHDGLGLLVIIAACVALLAGCDVSPTEAPSPGACWLNHSGVQECAAIEAPTWRPIDPTDGGNIVL